jgi:hypothetical protein
MRKNAREFHCILGGILHMMGGVAGEEMGTKNEDVRMM